MLRAIFFKLKLILVAVLAVHVAACIGLADDARIQIIDGSPVPEHQFPYVARLTSGGDLYCTGTLVGPRHVLTAGHCFFDERNRRVIGDTDFEVRLGAIAYNSQRVFVHPSFQANSFACAEGQTDAAIIELAGDVSNVTPVSLQETALPIGSTLALVGYGEQGNGAGGQNGTIPGLGTVNVGFTLIEGYGTNPPQQDPNSTYYYWSFDPGESNTASGDSGGPAFYQVGQQLYLAAITCGGEGNAEFGTLSFDTRVDLIAPWIYSIIGNAPTNQPPGLSTLSTQYGGLNQAFAYTIPVTGTPPFQISVQGLPAGLSFDGTSIVGTPTVAGAFTIQVSANNSVGGAAGEFQLIVSGFSPSLSVKKVLLQFDYNASNSDFLDITGKIAVGSKFIPKNKTVTVQIGRFTKEFILRSNGRSVGGSFSYFELYGPSKGRAFRKSTVGFDLTLEREAIFDELATLGFPASASASEGQTVPLPLSITVNGLQASITTILGFSARDQRWRKVE